MKSHLLTCRSTDETESETGSVADLDAQAEQALIQFDPSAETIADRIYALKDIVSPTTRETLLSGAATSASLGKSAAKLVGSAGWYLTTTAILIGLPLALAVEGEAVFAQQEKMEREQQAGVQQVSICFRLLTQGPESKKDKLMLSSVYRCSVVHNPLSLPENNKRRESCLLASKHLLASPPLSNVLVSYLTSSCISSDHKIDGLRNVYPNALFVITPFQLSVPALSESFQA